MPLPADGYNQLIPYAPVASPAAGSDALTTKPLGLGNAVTGGTTLSPRVTLGFTGAADLYVGLSSTIAPGEFFILGGDAIFRPISAGMQPWGQGVASIDAPLFSDIPATLLPAGTYNMYLMAVPGGTDLTAAFPYYLWNTALVILPPYLGLSSANIDFGQISAAASQDLILTNTSAAAYAITVGLNDPSGVFRMTASTCPATLEAQQSCKVTVSANPGAISQGGVHSTDIYISVSPPDPALVLTIPAIVTPIAPIPCTYTLGANGAFLTIAGGQGSFTVSVSDAGCSWTATSSNPSWLKVLSPTGTRTTSGTVTFEVEPNDGASAVSRSGRMTVAGQKFSVYQEGAWGYISTMQWNRPEYFSFPDVIPNGPLPSKGRPSKFFKITVPAGGCPTHRIEFWLSGMAQAGNMLIAGPDNEFGSLDNAWAIYEQKLAFGQGAHQEGPDYWFGFNTLSSNEAHIIMNGSIYNGRTFYIMVVNEGPGSTNYRVGAYCN